MSDPVGTIITILGITICSLMFSQALNNALEMHERKAGKRDTGNE